jgi:hypothetical protein
MALREAVLEEAHYTSAALQITPDIETSHEAAGRITDKAA